MKSNVSQINSNKLTLKKILNINGIGAIIAFIVLFVVLSITADNFFQLSNIVNIIKQSVFVAIIGIGMTFVIAMSDIDLSVGSTLGVCGVVVAALITAGVNVYVSVLISILVGAFIGLVNGLLVTKLSIPPFIVTLGTMSILRGAIMVYTGGIPIYGLRVPAFQFFAQGSIGPIPFMIIILAVLVAVFYYVLYHTKFGRHVISIGSNKDAASLVGINTNKIKIIVYVIVGVLCAIAGVLLTSRSEAAVSGAGSSYEMDVIAATVIGGTSLSGGKGNLGGTIVGAILMTMVRNGLNLLGISSLWHQVVIGIFILIAVGFDAVSSKRAARNS